MVKLNGNDEIANTVKPNLAGANTILKLNGFTQSLAGLTDGGVGTAGTVGNYHATNASTLTLALAGSNTFNGILANGGAGVLNVAVSGTGSQTLTGHSTYTGTTSITAGVLALADSASLGNTPISITGGSLAPRAGAAAGSGSASITLGGTGVFDMSADNGNTLGTFTLSGAGTALSLTGGGTMKLNLGSTLGNNDSLLVAGGGTASTSGTTLLDILTTGNASLTPGDYTLLSVAGGGLDPADFQFVGNTSTMNVVVGANAYTLSLGNSTSTAEILTVSATAVPEPATLGLLACGAMGLLVRRRRHA
jgi:autotransporter-associated beta strand protein